MSKYCNLHVHSQFSTLDGFGSPDALVKRAAELGQVAIGLTDHGNLSGAMEFKISCDKAGIKPVIGSELYIAPWGREVQWRRNDNKRGGTSFHLTCWAYNQAGYKNLLKLTELANKVGFYYNPRIDYAMLEQYNEGLIVTSGCMASATSRALNPETGVTNSDYKQVNEIFGFMADVFGLDRYYIELQDHGIQELREINVELSRVNKHYGFEYLTTNDSHYPKPEDAEGQAAVMCVGMKCSLINPSSFVQGYIDHPGYYLTDYDQMTRKDFGFTPPESAFTNTIKVAEMVEPILMGYEPEVKKYRFPVMPEYEDNYGKHLNNISMLGFCRRYPDLDDRGVEAQKRLEYELRTINDLGFASYFLCVYDISQFCIERGIPMTVRGSAGGSMVLYCLHVTDFCPLEYNLIFERFINADRVSAPDADLDLDKNRRPEVIKYIVDKYGADFVAQVATFSRIKGRGAIRDATRLIEADFDTGSVMVNRMNESIKATVSGSNSRKSEWYVANFIQTRQEQMIFDAAIMIEGQIRSTGIHAGALMLSNRPLVEDYPLMRPKSTSKAVTQLLVAIDYESAEQLGGIKLDLLNVDALSILYEAIELVNERHNKSYTFHNIPVDDPASYDLINSGNLAEIFQLTGHTARRVAQLIKPSSVEDVMVINSLARPGPLQYTDLYADRKHGRKLVTYDHPDLEPILMDTQGIIIYQEQAMRVSQVIAGFTGGEADKFRKAISKKKGIDVVLEKFRQGATEKGYSSDFIDKLVDDLVEFGQYCFNASHACAYSRIAVKQAYLKARYPIEYYAASMTGRAKNEGKLDDLLKEMLNFGIRLLPPSLGYSHPNRFMIDDEENAIRYPYASVKNVGKAGNYLQRITLSHIQQVTANQLKLFKKAGKRALEVLALVGAFDHLFSDRNEAVRAVPYLSRGVAPVKQMSFLDGDDYKYSDADFLAAEREFTGLYLTGHPLDKYTITQPKFSDAEIYENMKGELRVIIGIVNSIRLHRDRKGSLMAFVTIEDHDYNEMSVVVFGSLYTVIHERINVGSVIRVLGEVNVRYGQTEEEDQKIAKYGRVSIVAKNIIGE